MAIEAAIVVPVLAMVSVGVFEVGNIVSRQQELQSAASEAETIVLAALGGSGSESSEIEDVLEKSLGLEDDDFKLNQRFRCNSADTLVASADSCDVSDPIYVYVQIEVTDKYEPVWSKFGIGEGINYSLTRTIQVS